MSNFRFDLKNHIMKRIASLLLSLFLLSGIARSQVANISIILGTGYQDTVNVGDSATFSVILKNNGPDSIVSGTTFEFHTELDTGGTSNLLVNLSYYTWPFSLMPGDSIVTFLGDVYYVNTLPPYGPYKIGGNIVVIWPAAYMSSQTINTSDSLILDLFIIDPNGVIEFINGEIVNVYPNPTKAELNITKSGSEILPEKVRIYDVSGKEVLVAENIKTISIAHLSAGIYYVKVRFNNSSHKTFKIIKQNR